MLDKFITEVFFFQQKEQGPLTTEKIHALGMNFRLTKVLLHKISHEVAINEAKKAIHPLENGFKETRVFRTERRARMHLAKFNEKCAYVKMNKSLYF